MPKSDDSSASAVEQVSGSPATAAGQPQQMSAAGSNQLTEPQMAKLQSELDVVQGNMRVLAEMLAFLTNPDQSKPDPADLELLTVSNNINFSCCTIFCNKLLFTGASCDL